MSFTWLHPRGVRSDEGFVVESRHFGGFTYSEGARQIVLEGEFLYDENGDYGWGFGFDTDRQSAKWEPSLEPISKADWLRVVSNVTNACNFMKGRVKFR